MPKPEFEIDLGTLIHQQWEALGADKEPSPQWPSVDRVLDRLDTISVKEGYRCLAGQVALCLSEVIKGSNKAEEIKKYCKRLLVRAMTRFPSKYAQSRIIMPSYIPALYVKEFSRILNSMNDNHRDIWDLKNDIFCKDLAICCAHLIPVSCQVICVSGIPRRILFFRPFRALFEKLYYFCFTHKGFAPTFEIHMHPENKRYFTPEGRDQCYKVVADLLRLNPDFKGLQASSWFYDSQLREISPHLSYLTEIPKKYGAKFFYICDEDEKSGAFRTSVRRLQRFKELKYIPKTYLLSWPRKELLCYTAQLKVELNGQSKN